ncbi:UvrD-helicase domain-containing protein [Moraxella sp. VT-16-12]|uniref:UvrD-helicase domain-containing protein n=1 Tax=Moraxella sp. VT-16-12 TaxID=2014877 RepID=UPI000B7D62FD|nr:UvrD-helicase domain-containing protein [Moraxella sp. VT-16-12]TWV80665.1 AAA family ATPase [Moraxella sp. VT-16-12]
MSKKARIPAIDCELQGGYLIEASAGTGKTWTLTGILLRLLIEKKYPPEKIIATTFTRAAAAEMQERLQDRLNEFYHYIYWLQSKKQQHPTWFSLGFDEQNTDDVINQIKQHAKNAHIVGYDDPINIYLIQYLLTDGEPRALDFAVLRTSLLLSTLDKLFVGTLDSLAQKWLKEFSSEMSYQPDTKITMNDDEIIQFLIHDELRREHSFMATCQPRLYQMLGAQLFSQTENIFQAVGVSLQFYNADINETKQIDDSLLYDIDHRIDDMMSTDFSGLEPYYDLDNAKALGFSGNNAIAKQFGLLKDILNHIFSYKSSFLGQLNKEQIKFLNDLAKIDVDKLFKKGHEKNKENFNNNLMMIVKKIHHIYQELSQIKQNYQNHLYRKITISVKEKLKTTLENKQQSTFTFQMVRLNDAIFNNPSLAQHIRYLYPVILIDESQDINGLQRQMVEKIYLEPLNKEIKKEKKPKGFVLLVGDPKQAIYLFRGGDVINYIGIKNYGDSNVLNHSLILNENRRSHQVLIDGLNHWFEYADVGHHHFGDGIDYQHIIAHNTEQRLSWQQSSQKKLPDYLTHHAINVLYFSQDDKTKDEYQTIACHINSLLQNEHTIIDKDGKERAIMPSDIAVLARRTLDLDNTKHALNELGIQAISPKDIHVFSTPSAWDLYYLLSAVIDMTNTEKITKVLTSVLFGLSLEQSIHVLNDTNMYYRIMSYFDKARRLLYYQGVMVAINHCLSKNPLKYFNKNTQKDTLWEQIATQGERYMADLSQVIELIGVKQHSTHHNVSQFMSWFLSMMQGKDKSEIYHQLPLPSETGVTLMTIHKSKGLEFPIVYIFGLDDGISHRHSTHFYPYSDENKLRKISPQAHLGDDKDFYKKQKQQEEIEEFKRLGYVALTRASEQVFVIAKEPSRAENMQSRPLYLWFDCASKQLSLPDRLLGHVGWIAMNDVMLNDRYYQNKDISFKPVAYQKWQDVFKKCEFYGEHSTSATDMIDKLEKNSLKQTGEDDDIYIDVPDGQYGDINYPDGDIRQTFIKGKESGIFLHQILQLTNPDNISETINKTAKKLGFYHYVSTDKNDEMAKIYEDNHTALQRWIDDIISTPMSSSSASLKEIANHHCVKEMSFSLGVNPSFNPEKINELFCQYTDKLLDKLDNQHNQHYKYLNGEIDLVYEHQGKFYIVDYKSNFLGSKLSDYHQEALNIAMNKAGYWLQGLVYQVALHRLLSIRIDDYQGNEHLYLGGVEFIFLRGIDKQYPHLGHISWSIPIPMVLAFDALLGRYFQD